jgi:hypothetical protein
LGERALLKRPACLLARPRNTRDELPLSQAFFNPTIVSETGIDPIIRVQTTDQPDDLLITRGAASWESISASPRPPSVIRIARRGGTRASRDGPAHAARGRVEKSHLYFS